MTVEWRPGLQRNLASWGTCGEEEADAFRENLGRLGTEVRSLDDSEHSQKEGRQVGRR